MLILLWLGAAFPKAHSSPLCRDTRPRDSKQEFLESFSDINDSVILRQRRAASSSSRTERTSLQGGTPSTRGLQGGRKQT